MTRIIGLTGFRQTGKSTIATHLQARHGFIDLHAFAGGKVATEAYFRHLGADEDLAHRMVHGDLRDTPSPLLPLRSDLPEGAAPEHHSPRFFMEMFGNFMGETLGSDWTAGAELRLASERHPGRNLLIQSVVYEVDAIRAQGGTIIRIDRPGAHGRGLKTDRVVEAITPDEIFLNDHGSVEDMLAEFDRRFMESDQAPSLCTTP